MTAAALLIAAALLGQASAGVVELNCSDNSTCIDNMAREFVRSVRQQKTVRLFDALTVEPLKTRQARQRSDEGVLSRFLQSHAFTFDWNDYTFKLWKAQDRNDALDIEVFESRTAKDVSEEIPKKSKSKVEEEDEEEVDKKAPSAKHGIIKRRAKKKIMQAVIPMLFGMKSAGTIMFGMAVVTILTMKAFMASKLALMVTMGMAAKRLYESYSLGFPEALWNLARYFKILFGFPAIPALRQSPSMTMPMYLMPQMQQMYGQAMAMQQMPQMQVPQ